MNNFSPLPFYDSVEEQNARRWWVYGREYPLFVSQDFLLPFQFSRQKLGDYDIEDAGIATRLIPVRTFQNSGISYDDADTWAVVDAPAEEGNTVCEYALSGEEALYFTDIPVGLEDLGLGGACSILFTQGNMALAMYNEGDEIDAFNGGLLVPEGADTVYVQIETSQNVNYPGWVTLGNVVNHPTEINEIDLFRKDDTIVADVTIDFAGTFKIKTIGNRDYICYVPQAGAFARVFDGQIGQFYLKLSDGTNSWYSEVFTVVADMSPYLRLEWWDDADFVMDAGTIVYALPDGWTWHNILYLDADIAKPEYIFEEEVEERDGYTFPLKQISEKRYKFSFLASEYMLDCLRFVRMADHIVIVAGERDDIPIAEYAPDTFLLTPEWESEGDVAVARVEFDTDTVAKKTGLGYLRAAGN